ncbi:MULTISPECIES: hypothetical protein [Pseudomonas]|uniref:AAA+ ATPase domain-containing protein n=1 Tax=Pseudomonas quercus TaxID=2722792 RepID=A0ABX0YIG3_9PSED|nr:MULTISPECIES: hypothetical protein [Pseudomonas]MBF7144688.1 hypothetical protein [Pseudomonas sp. LY10J]NJP03225.1 hypothetical protein [Pseudomonas quercus]
MTYTFNLARLVRAQPTEVNDTELGHPLIGACAEPSEPIAEASGTRRLAAPSSRVGAQLITGSIQRLSDAAASVGQWLPAIGRQHAPSYRPVGDEVDLELAERPATPAQAAASYGELDHALKQDVDDVLANSFNWHKAGTETGKALARGAVAGVAVYGAYTAVDALIQAKAPRDQQGTARGLTAMGMLTPVYQEGKELLNGVREAVTTKAKLSYPEALEKTHLRRQAQNAAYLKTLPEHIQTSCRKIDIFLLQAFAAAKKGDKVNYGLIRGMMHWRQDFMIGRPMKTQEVQAVKTDAGRADLLARMQHQLNRYPPELRDKLSGFTLGIAARSLERELPPEYKADAGFNMLTLKDSDDWHRWAEVPSVNKQMMMLAGAPGTGKSRYAEHVLPELLGLPVQSLVMPDKQAGGINALMAKEWSALEQDEFVTADTDAMGKIGLLLNRANCTNPILLLDEADLDDMDGIKRLTDPSRKQLEAIALETLLDFSNVTILMGTNALRRGANTPVDGGAGELEPALADRLEMAVFEGTDALTKREAAVSAYHGWAGMYCLPVKDGDGALLDRGQQNRLQGLFKGCLDYIVESHHDKAKIPGARMQVPVASVVNFIAWRLMGEKHGQMPPLQPHQIRTYIDQFYSLRMSGPRQQPAADQDLETVAESSQMAEQRAAQLRDHAQH